MARWGMSSIVVLLPEELSTRYNGCPLKMIGYRPEISLIRGNGWSGRKHLQRKRIKPPLLNDFQVKLYGEIWLCRNVLFHAWEKSQGISAASKLRGPSINSSPIVSSPHTNNSSLATVSQDSWISWISSSIIRGGSWISHLDFLRRLTVQPLRISFW
ncbi:hypothetical protein GLOIN_2v1785001 [Rhizophagus irregularis DAOM 181602=DAOM 197198]|nr:hypothetical protein GLOIN_2v1785001 [Rhizophagus irregularis DAOM 181602=DAOM 197198]